MDEKKYFPEKRSTLNETLKTYGKKNTKLGLEIFNLLVKNKKPLTASGIHKKIKLKADLSSVYRTLKRFLELNLISEEIISKESYYFISENHHHHIICQECGYMECIPCNEDFSWISNFTQVTHSLNLKGLCNDCSKAEKG